MRFGSAFTIFLFLKFPESDLRVVGPYTTFLVVMSATFVTFTLASI